VAPSHKNGMLKLSNAFEGLDAEDPPSELEEIVAETQLVKKTKSWEKTYEMDDRSDF
jgi:hypothetical protein